MLADVINLCLPGLLPRRAQGLRGCAETCLDRWRTQEYWNVKHDGNLEALRIHGSSCHGLSSKPRNSTSEALDIYKYGIEYLTRTVCMYHSQVGQNVHLESRRQPTVMSCGIYTYLRAKVRCFVGHWYLTCGPTWTASSLLSRAWSTTTVCCI